MCVSSGSLWGLNFATFSHNAVGWVSNVDKFQVDRMVNASECVCV